MASTLTIFSQFCFQIYTVCTQQRFRRFALARRFGVMVTQSFDSLHLDEIDDVEILGILPGSRHAVAGLLLVHLMWHAGASLVLLLLLLLLHVWTGTAVELLPLCVSHIGWSARHFRDASSVLLGWSWAEAAGWRTTVHWGLDRRRRHAGLVRHGVLIRSGAGVVVDGVKIRIFSMCTGW